MSLMKATKLPYSSGRMNVTKFEIISNFNVITQQIPRNILTGMLLNGDRITCCTHAVIALIDDQLAGICTIAPERILDIFQQY